MNDHGIEDLVIVHMVSITVLLLRFSDAQGKHYLTVTTNLS